MTITREQFVRGFNAIRTHYDGQWSVEDAARDAGFQDFQLGATPVASELERRLAERCRVREDESGPWPEDSIGEDDISLALHAVGFSSITDEHGKPLDFPTTAEGLWEMWEREKSGPFRGARHG